MNITPSFLDPNAEIEIRQGILPHWQQKGTYYFVTFRLADSTPKCKKDELKSNRERWNNKHKHTNKFTEKDWVEYNHLFNQRVEDWLNAGYNSCLLRKSENATIVAYAL